MENYKLEITSMWLHYLRYLFCIGVSLATIFIMLPLWMDSELKFLGLFMLFNFLAWRLTSKLDKGKVSITMDEERLDVIWLKNFRLFPQKNKSIPWDEIHSHRFMPHSTNPLFIIETKKNKSLRLFISDDSLERERFLIEFGEQVEKLKGGENRIEIKKKSTFYDTLVGRNISTIIGVCFLLLVLGSLLFRPLNEQNWFLIIPLLLFGFVSTFIEIRKRYGS